MKQLKKYRVNIRITEAEWIELHQQPNSITQYVKQGKLQCAIIGKENLILHSNVKDNIGSVEAQPK
jgi:ATP phosphoribosyltransferase